jgi:hypothetical protein
LTDAKPIKECIIPHTVPNKPIYGLEEAIMAKILKLLSKRSISQKIDG